MAAGMRERMEGLRRQGYAPRLKGMRGSVRFDAEGVGSWLVTVDDGNVTVREGGGDADCIMRASEEDFLRIASGAQNPLTAMLQGLLVVEGDAALALKVIGLMPSPVRAG